MRVQFEITPDDIVDVTLRGLNRSATYRARRTRNVLSTAAFTAGLMFLVGLSRPLPLRLVMSAFGGLLGAVIQMFTAHWSVERRLREHCVEQLGTDEAVNFQVELTPQGILTEGQGTQINFVWPNVEEIVETDDSIDFLMRNASLVVVRKRAFNSAEEMRRFLALAAEYRAQPHTFSEPAPHV